MTSMKASPNTSQAGMALVCGGTYNMIHKLPNYVRASHMIHYCRYPLILAFAHKLSRSPRNCRQWHDARRRKSERTMRLKRSAGQKMGRTICACRSGTTLEPRNAELHTGIQLGRTLRSLISKVQCLVHLLPRVLSDFSRSQYV